MINKQTIEICVINRTIDNLPRLISKGNDFPEVLQGTDPLGIVMDENRPRILAGRPTG